MNFVSVETIQNRVVFCVSSSIAVAAAGSTEEAIHHGVEAPVLQGYGDAMIDIKAGWTT